MEELNRLRERIEREKNKMLPIWNKPALPPYISRNVIKGRGRIKLVKGSAEAKAFMARLRAMRGKNRAGKKRGGANPIAAVQGATAGLPLGAIGSLLKFGYIDYGKSWHAEKTAQEKEIEELDKQILSLKAQISKKKKSKKGGGDPKQEAMDFFHGPIGWIRWGRRNARARQIENKKKEIEQLKKQLEAAI